MFSLKSRLVERREKTRVPTAKQADILYCNRACRMACTVVDISRSGARLRPSEPMLLPNEIELHFAPNTNIKCEVIHRTGDEIGVHFLR